MEDAKNQNSLRALNTALVRAALKAEGSATKLRLAQLTGLSTVTVGAALELLTAGGEVSEGPMVPSNGGRPAKSYRFVPEHRHVLALYIQGDILCCQVADLYGRCIFRREGTIPQLGGDCLMPAIGEMLERYPAIGVIGIGVPGVEVEGVVTVSDRPELSGARLTERYQGAFGLPVAVENDVNLAVLGYCGRPEVDGEETVVYLYFPEGGCPGAGLRLPGGLYRGRHSGAGEIKCLPPAVDWPSLDWTDFDQVCDRLASVVASYACILDPDRMVLYGPSLTEAHRQAVQWSCSQTLEMGLPAQLCLSDDFNRDYGAGTVFHALERLEGGRTWPPFS